MAVYAQLDSRGQVINLLALRPEQASEFPGCVPVGDTGACIGCRRQEDGFYLGSRRLLTAEEYWIGYARQVGEGLAALLGAAEGGDEPAVAAALWEEENA